MTTTAQQATGTEWTQEETDEVTIEASVLVYLNWDAKNRRWYVAPSTMDGYQLDHHGESMAYTDFGGYDEMPPQKQQEWKQAEAAEMPTGPELLALLAEAEPNLVQPS